VRESVAKDSRLTDTEIPRQLADLLLFLIDKFTPRLSVHPAESVSDRPNAPARSFARLEYHDPAATPFQLPRGGKSCEPGSDDQH
jgi:hypothetical protein